MQINDNIIIKQGDCLELMKDIPDKSIDMVLCDLPYGTTACKWDTIIPFDKLWEQYERIIKDKGAICLFGSEPFSSKLRMSNLKLYKYDWVWEKTKFANFALIKKQPRKMHENIIIFYYKQPIYNPQMEKGEPYKDTRIRKQDSRTMTDGKSIKFSKRTPIENDGTRYPKSVIKFSNPSGKGHLHPTQKPVELCEYLIKTYTNEGETVLDNCMGSGTTAIACINTNRNFIGFELDKHYYDIANERIQKALAEKAEGE